uniref:Globin domain-containing protein n=1 Tax=Rhodnius prolixus TaxID=13249 RepID=T1IE76_RHOPR
MEKCDEIMVMAFVQKAVARLHEPEKLDQLLKELGKKHYGYKAKAKYVDLVGPQFIQAIQPSLQNEWSPEVIEIKEQQNPVVDLYSCLPFTS